MAREGFDFGGEAPLSSAGMFKQPEVGQLTGRVRSIIHLGRFEKVWKGKKNPAAPYVAVVFELHEQWEDEEGGVPLTTSICFPLKKGDKASMVKFLNAVDPEDTAAGFDDIIGLPASLLMEGSKDLDDDGMPKFVNCKAVSAVPKSIVKHLPALHTEGAGHCTFDGINKEAIMELNPYLHVVNIMEKAVNFDGSTAQGVLVEIRTEDPEYGKASDKSEDDGPGDRDEREAPPEPDLDENQEY